jgi:hypothetical protein
LLLLSKLADQAHTKAEEFRRAEANAGEEEEGQSDEGAA